MGYYSRVGEAAGVVSLGVAIILGATTAPHDDGWPRWALLVMAIGAAIIIFALLNLVFWMVHRPSLFIWGILRRVRVGLKPAGQPVQEMALDADYFVQRAAGAQSLATLIEERDALQAKFIDVSKRFLTQQILTIKAEDESRLRDSRLDDLKPIVDWATDLIESERGRHPIYIDPQYIWIHKPETLRGHEAKFELRIGFQYFGVHRLIIGERFSGALARYNGDTYNYDTKVSFAGLPQQEVFDHTGYASGTLCLLQKVSRESADALLALMEKGDDATVKEGTLTIRTTHLSVSVRLTVPFSGELLFDGVFPLGEDVMALTCPPKTGPV